MIYSKDLINQKAIYENITEDINALAFSIAEISCLAISV